METGPRYMSIKNAAIQLGCTDRTVRNLCEENDWFGAKLDPEDSSSPWVLTPDEVNRMNITPRRSPGRPREAKPTDSPRERKPIVAAVA